MQKLDWRGTFVILIFEYCFYSSKLFDYVCISSGGNATNPKLMGQTIVEGLKEYLEENDLRTLKHVYLVIFQPDMVTSMLQGISQASQTVPGMF